MTEKTVFEDNNVSMSDLLKEDSDLFFNDNSIIKAIVLDISYGDVTLDIGAKSEYYLPLEDFLDDNGNINLKVGDSLNVFVERNNNGTIKSISYKKLKDIENFETLKEKFELNIPIKCKIVSENKGGYLVKILRLDGFLPKSQLPQNLQRGELIGKEFDALILEIRKSSFIVSVKNYQDKIKKLNLEKIKSSLKVGQIIKGTVKTIKSYGAFIDLGGVDGFLYIKDMSWGRIKHPSDMLSLYDEVEVMIKDIDKDTDKITLSLKDIVPCPWDTTNLKEGDIVNGKVIKILQYVVIINVADGIDGALHISDLSWIEKVRKIDDVLKVGDEIKVKVLSIDKKAKKLSLGLKQIEMSPWDKFISKYKEGDKVLGKVSSIIDYGIFVEVEKGLNGLVHVNDISWGKIDKVTPDMFKKGEELEVLILKINTKLKKLALGLKQKSVDPILKYKVKENYKLIVKYINRDNLVLDLGNELDGLVLKNNASDNRNVDLLSMYKIGDEVNAKLIKIDFKSRELFFSIRDYLLEQEKLEINKYMENSNIKRTTLAEHLSDSILNKLKSIE